MADRNSIHILYRQMLAERWHKGRLMPDDVRAIQVFCEVHQITVEEHRAAVAEVGLDVRELMDEHSHSFEDWLASRRKSRAAGSGALRAQPAEGPSPWLKKVTLPAGWQTGLAVAAGIILLAVIAYFVFSL